MVTPSMNSSVSRLIAFRSKGWSKHLYICYPMCSMNSLNFSRLSLTNSGPFSTYSILFTDSIFLFDFSSFVCLYAASSLLKSLKLLLRVIYHSSLIAILTLVVCLISPLIVLDAIPEIPGNHELTNV